MSCQPARTKARFGKVVARWKKCKKCKKCNVSCCVVLCRRLSELLDRPAVVRDMASSHTLDTVVVFAEDLVRKRQRPHCYVMSVDVSGRVADAGSRVKGQGPRAKGQGGFKGQGSKGKEGYALALACCTLSGLMPLPGFLHSHSHDA